MLTVGDHIAFNGKLYILTTEISPIDNTCINNTWYPSAFTASAYSPDDTHANGWYNDYYVFFDLLPDANCTAAQETLCDWNNPSDIDWSGSLYNPTTHNWKQKEGV